MISWSVSGRLLVTVPEAGGSNPVRNNNFGTTVSYEYKTDTKTVTSVFRYSKNLQEDGEGAGVLVFCDWFFSVPRLYQNDYKSTLVRALHRIACGGPLGENLSVTALFIGVQ